jgi:putative transposase
MPVRRTVGYGGHVFHVMNRAIHGHTLFNSGEDYARFVCTLDQARAKSPIRILSYCVMPNHFHLLLWPVADDDLPAFVHRLCSTHAKRYRTSSNTVGRGAVYGKRYKAVAIHDDRGLFCSSKYVVRNPVRAGFVPRCEDWPYSSATADRTTRIAIDPWPVPQPKDWSSFINDEEPSRELDDIRTRIAQDQPIGRELVVRAMIASARLRTSDDA